MFKYIGLESYALQDTPPKRWHTEHLAENANWICCKPVVRRSIAPTPQYLNMARFCDAIANLSLSHSPYIHLVHAVWANNVLLGQKY